MRIGCLMPATINAGKIPLGERVRHGNWETDQLSDVMLT